MRHWFPCACGHKVLGVKCALSQPLGSANNDAVFTVFRENKHNKTPCAVSRPTPQSEVRNGPSPIHVNATKCSDVFVQCGIKGQSLLNCWSRWNLASHAEMKHLAPLKTMKPDVVMYEFPESAKPTLDESRSNAVSRHSKCRTPRHRHRCCCRAKLAESTKSLFPCGYMFFKNKNLESCTAAQDA